LRAQKKTLPNWSKVVGLMDRLIKEIAGSKTHPVKIAAFMHHRLCRHQNGAEEGIIQRYASL
jgi:Fic family protein